MTKPSISAFAVACLAAPAVAAEAPLQVAGVGVRAAALQISDLQAMKPVEETWTAAGDKRVVVGVPVERLLQRQGLTPGRMGDDGTEHGKGWRRVVVASAPDGFQAVFSVAELTEQMGATRALVAWKIDGKTLPPDRGPLRLVVLTDKVASRSVHAINRLEVVQLGTPGGGDAHEHDRAAPQGSAGEHGAPAPAGLADGLARVAEIHGAAGPFAVAGYRMGQRALRELGLTSGSFDLEVRHESPAEVQWSCIADGAQAATGASAGKLNLSVQRADRDKTRTVFRRKSTGKTVAFTLQPTFVKRFLDAPRAQLPRAGSEAMSLADADIFTLVSP